MYNIANNVWDSYFRNKKETRSLRREATNSYGVRVPTSVVAKQMPDRKLHAEEAGQRNSFQKQNNRGERNARHHSVIHINHSKDR